MECKRKIEEERKRVKFEARVKKVKKALALKKGFVDDDIFRWNMQRCLEWKAYKTLLQDAKKYREFRDKEMETMEKQRLKRLEEIIRMQNDAKGIGGHWSSNSSVASSQASCDQTDIDESASGNIRFDAETKAQPINYKESQQQLRKKRTKRLNLHFQLPELDFKDDLKTASFFQFGRELGENSGEILSGPWKAKRRSEHPLEQESRAPALKPVDWLDNAFSSIHYTNGSAAS